MDSKHTHKAWVDTELSKLVPGGIPFPMLADCGGHIGRAFGVYDEGPGSEQRAGFIIDPDGVVWSMEVLGYEVGRDVGEMIRQIEAFQHVRSTGEVMPAGWRPGQPALKPSAGLVGHVWEQWRPETSPQRQREPAGARSS